jgi:hypothetical protein
VQQEPAQRAVLVAVVDIQVLVHHLLAVLEPQIKVLLVVLVKPMATLAVVVEQVPLVLMLVLMLVMVVLELRHRLLVHLLLVVVVVAVVNISVVLVLVVLVAVVMAVVMVILDQPILVVAVVVKLLERQGITLVLGALVLWHLNMQTLSRSRLVLV